MGLNTNKNLSMGYISKDKILEHVTEEDIFEIVFGFKPVEHQYVTSPFRKDNSPGCWFEYNPTRTKLKFKDFGGHMVIKNKNLINIDCFDAVQLYFKIPNFYLTLEFIYQKLILGKNLSLKKRKLQVFKSSTEPKKRVNINIEVRNFNRLDKEYWQEYGVSKENLIEDNVFPVVRYHVENSKKGNYSVRTYDLCYAYTNFKDNRKKLYRPYQIPKRKFLTNCLADDIGGYDSLPEKGKNLVISKSYKDYRVLKNTGLNVIWFQNEGMFPSKEIIKDLCKRFTYITVFFDNDEAGEKASLKLVSLINSYFENKSGKICLPKPLLKLKVKDPSDFYKKYSKKLLIQFLSQKKLL